MLSLLILECMCFGPTRSETVYVCELGQTHCGNHWHALCFGVTAPLSGYVQNYKGVCLRTQIMVELILGLNTTSYSDLIVIKYVAFRSYLCVY